MEHLTAPPPDPLQDTPGSPDPAVRPVAVSSDHPSLGLPAGPSTGVSAHPASTLMRADDDAPARHLRLVRTELSDEDGSLVTEYGLLAVVAATIAGVVITWASNGALTTLFNALLRQARSLVGA